MNFLKNNLILIFIIVVIFGVARIANGVGDSSLLTTSSNSNKELLGSNILTLLLKLKSVSIDGSLFKEKAFINLKDFSTKIPSQPVGRSNPFDKIGAKDDGSIGFNSSSAGFKNISTTTATNANTVEATSSETEGI